jgi:hypothetical protein
MELSHPSFRCSGDRDKDPIGWRGGSCFTAGLKLEVTQPSGHNFMHTLSWATWGPVLPRDTSLVPKKRKTAIGTRARMKQHSLSLAARVLMRCAAGHGMRRRNTISNRLFQTFLTDGNSRLRARHAKILWGNANFKDQVGGSFDACIKSAPAIRATSVQSVLQAGYKLANMF